MVRLPEQQSNMCEIIQDTDIRECPTGIDMLVDGEVIEVEKIVVAKRPVYSFFKRMFDVILSLFGLIVACVPMLIVGVVIMLTSKGGPIYKQTRLGLNGKSFVLYKFRSMYTDAESSGPQWASKNDERVTPFGNFLRKTRVDELPQLINILKGDMSFVGPRPERSVFYEEFEKTIHGFSQRLLVVPGLTGWAQVNGGYDLKPKDKIIYDIEYIKNRSFGLDIKCIFKTIAVVFTNDGAR